MERRTKLGLDAIDKMIEELTSLKTLCKQQNEEITTLRRKYAKAVDDLEKWEAIDYSMEVGLLRSRVEDLEAGNKDLDEKLNKALIEKEHYKTLCEVMTKGYKDVTNNLKKMWSTYTSLTDGE